MTQHKTSDHWLYGRHSTLAALRNPKRIIRQLLLTKQSLEFLKENGLNPEKIGIKYTISKNEDIVNNLKYGDAAIQGIAAQTERLVQPSLSSLLKSLSNTTQSALIILDQVSDPHNVGAIVRTAAAFGAHAVITTHDHCPGETGALVKAAAGTFELIPFIAVVNLAQTLKLLKEENYWICGLDGKAHNELGATDMNFARIAVVLGSEENGMRNLTKQNCDFLVRIGIAAGIESLNVSNAAAIVMHSIMLRS